MDNVSASKADSTREKKAIGESVSVEFTLYVVVTNRDVFLKECVHSFRKCYPSVKIVLVDNSGTGQYRKLGESLGLQVETTDRIRSVSENQNWILDHSQTKYFAFSADDIVFLQPGFLEEAAALHAKGLELVSFGVDDPCAFSMIAGSQPRIGRFNTDLAGKELTDWDIKIRSEKVYGYLPSVGGYWRMTPLWWESKYITHRHDKPDVNQFLVERGMAPEQVLNERVADTRKRVFNMLYERLKNAVGAGIFNYGNILLRRGLHPGVFEVRDRFRPVRWPNNRMLSVGQVPRHMLWPYWFALHVGAPKEIEKVIVEKCEAYRPFLEQKFSPQNRFRVIADDVLNVDKYYQPRSVDVAVWFDGPEHLEKEAAQEALQKLERITTGMVLIGTPLGFLRQGADSSYKKISNPYNAHRSGWETAEFERLGYETHVCRTAPIPAFIAWKYI